MNPDLSKPMTEAEFQALADRLAYETLRDEHEELDKQIADAKQRHAEIEKQVKEAKEAEERLYQKIINLKKSQLATLRDHNTFLHACIFEDSNPLFFNNPEHTDSPDTTRI